MVALKAFIKPFEAPQRSVKIKISVNSFFSSGIGKGGLKQGTTIYFLNGNKIESTILYKNKKKIERETMFVYPSVNESCACY